MKKVFYLLVSLAFFGSESNAQLSLAPTAVYLDKNGIGNLFVTNNSGVPQEITINFQFGYSDQDENGILVMQYGDTANARLFGLDPYVKAFPRTFILPPNQQQIVRLQVRASKGLAPGTYFTRIKVGSSGQVADVGTEETSDGIATRVNLRFEQVIVAFYKNGAVNTGVKIDKLQANIDSSNILTLDTWYKTTGNSPYLGRVEVKIRDPKGKIVAETRQTAAMYFSGKRRFRFRLENKETGRYEAEFKFETNRNDITLEDLIQAEPYTYKASFNLN